MKKTCFVLLGLALLAIPGAVVAGTTASGCQPADPDAAQEPLAGAPLAEVGAQDGQPPAAGEAADSEAIPLPWGGFPSNVTDGRVDTAVPAPAPTCPAQTFCTGSSCSESGPCSYIDSGKRCCYDSSLNRICCPVGTTVHTAVCPCVGASCNNPTRQTPLCL